jgi:D-aminoacyl-tRNA deacylase
MRVIIQRVKDTAVIINNNEIRKINAGLMVLVGIEDEDTSEDIEWLGNKIINLRIFSDENGLMNKSILDTKGEIMVVSQFTLFASTKKGNRPSFIKSAKPDIAIPIYEQFVAKLESLQQKKIITGEFGADMQIQLINDGPVTIYIDTKNKE